jgi:arginyl-tRNA synthetase
MDWKYRLYFDNLKGFMDTNIKIRLQGLLKKAVDSIFSGLSIPDPELVPARKPEFGDYTTNTALQIAKTLKANPLETAQKIASAISDPLVQSADAVAPGFVNIRISRAAYFQALMSVMDGSYFSLPSSNEKMIIEFVSANPTGPLNVVSGRAASTGDALARIYSYLGKDVLKEYYVNDSGKQVRLLGESLWIRIRQAGGEKIELGEEHYHGEYLKGIADEVSGQIESYKNLPEEERIRKLSSFAVSELLSSHKEDLKKFGVEFDSWFLESTLHAQKALDEVFKILKDKGHIFESEGKQWFRSTAFGDEKDRVVIREDGTPTYVLADVAYHYSKIKRGFNRIIDIWGPDHHGYIPRLKGAMKALGFPEDCFEILIIQQVNLIEKGEKVKMSKRAGKLILLRDLIDEAGTDVTRYFLLMRSMSAHLDFDMELAKKQSDENPVYYIQYANARIKSVFRQAAEKGISTEGFADREWPYEWSPGERDLVKNLLLFNETVSEAGEKREPNIIAHYLHSLAVIFHKFYHDHSILSAETPESRMTRLLFAAAVSAVLTHGLGILGIKAPEKM